MLLFHFFLFYLSKSIPTRSFSRYDDNEDVFWHGARSPPYTYTQTISMISSIFYRDSLYITCDRYPSMLQRRAIIVLFDRALCFFVISASSPRSTGLNLDLIKNILSLTLALFCLEVLCRVCSTRYKNERERQDVGPRRAKPSRGRSQQDIREAYFFLKMKAGFPRKTSWIYGVAIQQRRAALQLVVDIARDVDGLINKIERR